MTSTDPELPQHPHTPWWMVLAKLTPFLALVWAVVSTVSDVV